MRRQRAQAGLSPLRDAAAGASLGIAGEAIHEALLAGGSAVDAVVAGFFAAAGHDAGVLLGSAAAIVGNVGSGVRAFDGRPLQPGKGAPRPRGFVDGAVVPDAARLGVPRAMSMVMLLHAYAGRLGLSALARAGVLAAKSGGADVRAKVLRRLGAAGPLGLRSEGVEAALLSAGAGLSGGLLTEADLESALPGDAEGRPVLSGEGDLSISAWPWSGEQAPETNADWLVDVLVAADSRGNVAAMSLGHQEKGVPLPSVELSAPLCAVPVRRGVARVTPGTELDAPGALGVVRLGRDLQVAFGLCGGEAAPIAEREASLFRALADGDTAEAALGALVQARRADRCVAAVRAPRATRAVIVVREG